MESTKAHNTVKNVFTVSPMVMVDTEKAGMGGVSDVWAQLWPMAKSGDDDDRATVLSYDHAVETKDMGYFVNVTECVTYLLFPFLTCGAQADWTTGIAVANTSMDDEAFPVNAGAAAQGGSVMIHAYPKSTAAEKMAMGHMSSPEMLADPISTGISGNWPPATPWPSPATPIPCWLGSKVTQLSGPASATPTAWPSSWVTSWTAPPSTWPTATSPW